MPVAERFNFTGGLALSPEFTALLVGLVLYTAAFIGEIVRGGIQAVRRGQVEAAHAIGLSRGPHAAAGRLSPGDARSSCRR